MHKFFAEIIAGIIPNQMMRNRWRGILRYGVRRSIKLMARLKYENERTPNCYLAICAIIKDEAQYFEEWIEWHKKMGVEKFYIYDNESSDNIKDVLAKYIDAGDVEYILWPGKRQQLPAYDDCLDKHRFDARWIAFIDLDEFIVPVVHKNIPEFLQRFEDFSAVEINWLVYGSNGAKTKKSGDVMERFKRHAVSTHINNRPVKSIVNPRMVFAFIRAHEVAPLFGKIVDSHGEPITTPYRNREPQHDVIRINHYAVKSYEEFLKKRIRGRVHTGTIRDMEYFEKNDLNDVMDD